MTYPTPPSGLSADQLAQVEGATYARLNYLIDHDITPEQELIAEVLHDVRQNAQDDDNFDLWWHNEYALTFAERLATTNPRFDRARFMIAVRGKTP